MRLLVDGRHLLLRSGDCILRTYERAIRFQNLPSCIRVAALQCIAVACIRLLNVFRLVVPLRFDVLTLMAEFLQMFQFR